MIDLNRIYLGDNLATMKTWPDSFIHTCVTSPPYYALRDYGSVGQIGLEATPEEFIARLVEVFREVRRVLRDDGTCWVNMGDSYATNSANGWQGKNSKINGERPVVPLANTKKGHGLKTKDLIGVPWMLAFALRADGWYLRQDIIWHKPNPMPESVTDRCTKSHEYIFLLSKSDRYYYDDISIREKGAEPDRVRDDVVGGKKADIVKHSPGGSFTGSATRNKRSVWNVGLKPFNEAHFATFPPDLIAPCILAGTSEKGVCDACGSPYHRDVERVPASSKDCPKTQESHESRGGTGKPVGTVGKSGSGRIDGYVKTLGWNATCECSARGLSKAIVLDPFMGAGTTALVAATYGRQFIGCELNPAYKAIADKRVANEVAQEKFL